MNTKVLILGKTPPPIGGVTIHVARLLHKLDKINFDYIFYNLNSGFVKIFRAMKKSKIVHLHTSNVYFRMALSFLAFIIGKKLIITYHGNINRYGRFKNAIDYLSLKMAFMPIVLNSESFEIAKKINNKTKLISAFIPPSEIESLPSRFRNDIQRLHADFKQVFCTNAYNVSFDKNKMEIYGISDLVTLFSKFEDRALIVSDPSGKYTEFILQKIESIPKNILFISSPHDFNAVIRESDCMIRFTTTDGDSLSVKESLLAGTPVIATNVVSRPKEVILVNNDIAELEKIIFTTELNQSIVFNEDASANLIHIYNKLL